MSAHVAPIANETEGLAGFLAQQQDAFRSVAYGLSDAQAASTPTVSALSVGGLLKHIAEVQEHWLQLVLAAPGRPVVEESDADKTAEHLDTFRFRETDSLEIALKTYDDVSARVLDAVRTVDLGVAVPVPEAPWFPKDIEAWSARWVWLHLIEELSRHAGHADIIREGIDGATMYELVAGREGWPETPWLKPWQPKQAPTLR